MSRPVIYIAGPYTKPDPAINVHNAVKVADALMDGHLAWPIVPHLTHLWHTISPRDYPDWIALDLALLDRCDGLIRLLGESPGADGEVTRARAVGLPVLDGVDPGGIYAWSLLDWFNDHWPDR